MTISSLSIAISITSKCPAAKMGTKRRCHFVLKDAISSGCDRSAQKESRQNAYTRLWSRSHWQRLCCTAPKDTYDVVLVTVRMDQLASILPMLANNHPIPLCCSCSTIVLAYNDMRSPNRKACFLAFRQSEGALPHEQSASVLFTNLPPLEVVSNSATTSPLPSCSFAQRTEVASMRRLRQIVHEAIGGVAVVLAERFRIRPFRWRQTWEQE
jgi:hypothetical protein